MRLRSLTFGEKKKGWRRSLAMGYDKAYFRAMAVQGLILFAMAFVLYFGSYFLHARRKAQHVEIDNRKPAAPPSEASPAQQ